MDISLEDMIAGCRRNDIVCQKTLYKKYYSLFMVMCFRYVPGREDAEEVLNNAFLRIFKYIDKFNNAGSFEGWMKRIVVNCCLDFIKKNRQHGKIISLHAEYKDGYLPVTDHELAGASSENNLAVDKYDKEYLLCLLQNLPENTRLVFNLYVFEQYNHREIGEVLNMAERTSQAHLAKARQLLAAELDKKKLMHKLQRV
jgi:RNA polymerase sigma factor (sigma-70 family)